MRGVLLEYNYFTRRSLSIALQFLATISDLSLTFISQVSGVIEVTVTRSPRNPVYTQLALF